MQYFVDKTNVIFCYKIPTLASLRIFYFISNAGALQEKYCLPSADNEKLYNSNMFL